MQLQMRLTKKQYGVFANLTKNQIIGYPTKNGMYINYDQFYNSGIDPIDLEANIYHTIFMHDDKYNPFRFNKLGLYKIYKNLYIKLNRLKNGISD